MSRRVYDCGDRALLLEFDDTADVLAWAQTLRDAHLPGVLDIVPAARTVLVTVQAGHHQAEIRHHLTDLHVERLPSTDSHDGADVTIDVVYDGADLDVVCELTRMSADEVVAAHTARPLRVGFGGFAPGFAYLVGGDPRLAVPRRAEPRTRVPAGAVGLAGEFSGVYPRESPGGWQLIGRTDAVLWDVDRDPPALLAPGMTVRFRAVGGSR